jgi:hypothetical protein
MEGILFFWLPLSLACFSSQSGRWRDSKHVVVRLANRPVLQECYIRHGVIIQTYEIAWSTPRDARLKDQILYFGDKYGSRKLLLLFFIITSSRIARRY